MRVAVIGGGLTGLTIAYRLSQKGHETTLFEKEKFLGGLATGFKRSGWNWTLENYFHHLFTTDIAAKKLIQELDLGKKLFYTQPKTSIHENGQISRFDSPLSILNSPLLSWPAKIRTGLTTAYLKMTPGWKGFEKVAASQWLGKSYGQEAYQTIWKPLLEAKFSAYTDKVSMAWFWARIKKRSAKLGYLEGGFQILIDKLAEKTEKNGGKIILGQEVTNYGKMLRNSGADRVVFTTPISVFLKIMGQKLPKNYQSKMSQLKMIGALNLVLVLKEKFLADGTYWLNINEAGFPFVAVVEHTNFINPKHYGNNHILYVGGYYPQNHRYFKMKKEAIFQEFLPYLKKINPRLDVKNYTLNANRFAQPVIPLNYSRTIPQTETPIPNVYLANMQTIYPWDRGMNYAIEQAERIADEVDKS